MHFALIEAVSSGDNIKQPRILYVTQEDAQSLSIRVPSVFLIRDH